MKTCQKGAHSNNFIMDNLQQGMGRLGLGDADGIMSLTLMKYFDFGDNIVLRTIFDMRRREG